MYSKSVSWVGFDKIKTYNPQWEEQDFDVLCLPENIETADSLDELVEPIEEIQLYKILKKEELNVLSLHDLGIKIPLIERRCDDVYLGTIVVREIVLPLVIGIISSWIGSKLINPKIHLNLKIAKPNKIVSIEFDGDGKSLEQILESIENSEHEE